VGEPALWRDKVIFFRPAAGKDINRLTGKANFARPCQAVLTAGATKYPRQAD
jgi:hypothetical protein